jgi:hypothetical protein
MRFVDLTQVRETDGAPLAWPKTVSPGSATGFDLMVPIPVDSSIALRLGAARNKNVSLGSAERLFRTLSQRLGPTSEYDAVRRVVRFDLRLLSPSPGSPTHVPFAVTLP